MPRFPAILAFFALTGAAYAQAVYRWEDAQGLTHYTDDPGTIPKGVTVFATDGEPISEMGRPAVIVVRKPVVETAPVLVDQKQVAVDPAIPSSSEQYWRAQFQAAREKVHSLEDEVASDKRRIDENAIPVISRYSCYQSAPYGRGGVRPGYYGAPCLQTVNPDYERVLDRIEKNRRALERAREELHELERQASFQAVPNEWRR